jgi:hypothetical protein
MPNKWITALKQWNGEKGGPWCVPRKGSPEYDAVRGIMDGRETPVRKAEREKGNVDRMAKALQQLRGVEAETRERNEERRIAAEERRRAMAKSKQMNEERMSKAMKQLRGVEAETKERNLQRKQAAPAPRQEGTSKEYEAYVADYERRKKDANDFRAQMQEQGRRADIRNQPARFFGAINYHFPIDAEPLLSFDEWSERKKAQEAYRASAPERYQRTLDESERQVLESFEKAQEPVTYPKLVNPIPSKKTELLEAIKQLGLKGFSGKGIDELKAMLEDFNTKYIRDRQRAQSDTTEYLTHQLYEIRAIRILMGLEKPQILSLANHIDDLVKARQAALSRKKASIPRRVAAGTEEGDRVSAMIREINAETQAFNDKYRTIRNLIQGAIHFKDSNRYGILEGGLSLGPGIPEPIEVYLKEADLDV